MNTHTIIEWLRRIPSEKVGVFSDSLVELDEHGEATGRSLFIGKTVIADAMSWTEFIDANPDYNETKPMGADMSHRSKDSWIRYVNLGTTLRRYTAVRISENTNAFGLYGATLLSKDGIGWEVGANQLTVDWLLYNKRETYGVTHGNNMLYSLTAGGFEIPKRMPPLTPSEAQDILAEFHTNHPGL